MARKSVIPFFTVLVNVLWWLFIAGACLLTVAAVVAVVVAPGAGDASGRMSFTWQAGGLAIRFPFAPGTEPAVSSVTMALMFVPALVLVALGGVILFHLRKIMKSLSPDLKFLPDTARRLSIMGWVTIGTGVLSSIVRAAAAWYFISHVRIEGVDLSAQLSPDWVLLFIGFVLFVLAEIWSRAAELQEDHDLTV
jgi:hypothetical protein